MNLIINRGKIIFWLPRILSIIFVLFLSLFSLDVFSEYNGWNSILPFLVHLLPSFVLLGIIIISWKRDLVGAIIFLSLAIFYILMVGFNRPLSWYVSISGPTIIVSILFFISWFQKRKMKEKTLINN